MAEPAREPRNARELAAIIERDRAKLVVRYRANPDAWRGIKIDPSGWYGDGSAWTDERIARALAWPQEMAPPRPVPRLRAIDGAANRGANKTANRGANSANAPANIPANTANTANKRAHLDQRREAARERMRKLRAKKAAATDGVAP